MPVCITIVTYPPTLSTPFFPLGAHRGIFGVLLQSTVRTTHPNRAIVQSRGRGGVASGDNTSYEHVSDLSIPHTL